MIFVLVGERIWFWGITIIGLIFVGTILASLRHKIPDQKSDNCTNHDRKNDADYLMSLSRTLARSDFNFHFVN